MLPFLVWGSLCCVSWFEIFCLVSLAYRYFVLYFLIWDVLCYVFWFELFFVVFLYLRYFVLYIFWFEIFCIVSLNLRYFVLYLLIWDILCCISWFEIFCAVSPGLRYFTLYLLIGGVKMIGGLIWLGPCSWPVDPSHDPQLRCLFLLLGQAKVKVRVKDHEVKVPLYIIVKFKSGTGSLRFLTESPLNSAGVGSELNWSLDWIGETMLSDFLGVVVSSNFKWCPLITFLWS